MKEIAYTAALAQTMEKMSDGGVFLSCGGDKRNTMTIAWGSIGVYWGVPTFVTMVRPQRYTIQGIKETSCFSVSVPTIHRLKEELLYAGTKSGAHEDKFTGHGITAVPAQKIDAPIIAECGLHYECVVRYAQTLDGESLYPPFLEKLYPRRDLHTLFYGEIVACYTTDN